MIGVAESAADVDMRHGTLGAVAFWDGTMAGFKGRKEDQRLVTGNGKFTSDWNLPGQAHAAFFRSDRGHARILSIDVSMAKEMPGVLAVLTAEDIARSGVAIPPNLLEQMPGRNGMRFVKPDVDLLAAERVRCVGQLIAMVVAETANQAHDALDGIMVDFEDLPVVTTIQDALSPGAPQLYDDVPGNLAFDVEYGDAAATESVFAKAPQVVSVAIENTRVVSNPMEPIAGVAHWNEEEGLIDFYRPTQGFQAGVLPSMWYFGGTPDKYRIFANDVGGSFGTRAMACLEHIVLMVASRQIKRPVKWVASRSETFLSDDHGRSTHTSGDLAFDDEGRFLAVRYSWLHDAGWFAADTWVPALIGNSRFGAVGPYQIPQVYGRIQIGLTNKNKIGAYRGAGRPEATMILEQLVDAAALKLGMDRFELRRINAIRRDQYPYTTPVGVVLDCGDHPGLIDDAANFSGWTTFAQRRAEAAQRGKVRGIGCSSYLESSGGMYPVRDQARIRFTRSGKAVVESSAGPSGQGHETAFAKVASETLGISYDDISVTISDPNREVHLEGGSTGGSRTVMIHGNCISDASRQVIRKGKALAAKEMGVDEADIDYADGLFRAKSSNQTIELLDLAARHEGELDSIGESGSFQAFPGGAHVAEVELDPETGVIEVINYVGVDDCGTVLHHGLLDGQLYGGIVQGIGQVLGEVAEYDENGQLLNGSFLDYIMPRAHTAPKIELYDHPVPSPTNELGFKGAGETGTTGALTTTYSAVMDAMRQLGVHQMDMPFTPGRVWQAIQEARLR